MGDLSWIDLVVLCLASFRFTHLIVYDEIASFLRKPFMDTHYETDESGDVIEHVEVKGSGLKNWIGRLLACFWCVGIWSSAFIVLIFLYVPVLDPVLVILAVAGAAAVIESRLH